MGNKKRYRETTPDKFKEIMNAIESFNNKNGITITALSKHLNIKHNLLLWYLNDMRDEGLITWQKRAVKKVNYGKLVIIDNNWNDAIEKIKSRNNDKNN